MVGDECGVVGEMRIGRGTTKYSEETFPSVILFAVNPTWPGIEHEPLGKPVTYRLSHGMAYKIC
jgi:hypothetical protein